LITIAVLDFLAFFFVDVRIVELLDVLEPEELDIRPAPPVTAGMAETSLSAACSSRVSCWLTTPSAGRWNLRWKRRTFDSVCAPN
jgi:hypothetical protein